MKLTKEHIGKKFRREHWASYNYFLLLAITSTGYLLGESRAGEAEYWSSGFSDWLPYEEPKQKKRIEAAPAIFKKTLADGKVLHGITNYIYSSYEEAKSNCYYLIKWPADFNVEKGVWYYEYEE